jgi:hypothetical protein
MFLPAHAQASTVCQGLRGDIQDIADRAGVSAPSCMRQFENLKRITKGVYYDGYVSYFDDMIDDRMLFTFINFASELVRRDSRSDEREREERSGKKNSAFGRDGEVFDSVGDYPTFLEKRYRLSKELASEYISFAFVSFHKVECTKRGVQVRLCFCLHLPASYFSPQVALLRQRIFSSFRRR